MPWRRKIGIFPWHKSTALQLLKSGDPFFSELIKLIKTAEKEIHIHVYIFDPDTTGKIVLDELCRAAKRGVYLRIWLDAYGSRYFPQEWEQQLIELGVEVNYYSRIKLLSGYAMGIRLHHKIFLFDSQVALLGGINISDHYSAFGANATWLDFGVRVEGNVCYDLLRICLGIERGFLPFQKSESDAMRYGEESGTSRARILQNHWLKAKFGISRQYRQRIRRSRKEIILLASYFLPSPALKRMLKRAARRGVRVQLVLGGQSDVRTVQYASQYFYEDLLKAGVEILEWQPSVFHAKVALIDEEWVCIGSYNLNYLSDFGSVECNVEVVDADFYRHCTHEIGKALQVGAVLIDPMDYLKQSTWYVRLRNYLSYRIISISFRLLFFLQKP